MNGKGEINPMINDLDFGQGHFDMIEYSNGNLVVSGWMLNPETDFDSFAIYIDLCKEGLCTIMNRDDVARAFPDIPHAKNAGFSFCLNIPPKKMDRNANICVVGFSKDKEITKIGTYYLCELKSDERVLDVGCGCGRMAVPLLGYLDESGSYEGFDIIAECISWCEENITRRAPNFRFQLANIYNKEYNSTGKIDASKYTFPYDEESFDFVFLTSVFTHMLPQEIENYLSEIARVLKKDGRCLITSFLLNIESLKLIDAKLSSLDFKYGPGKYLVIDKNIPESAVAYEESYVQRLYKKYNLNILDPICYGGWCGRKQFLSYQDIIISKK